MSTVKNRFWFWIMAGFGLLLFFIAVTLWQSYTSKSSTLISDAVNTVPESMPSSDDSSQAKNKAAGNTTSEAPLPAPAQKLQTLLKDPERMAGSVNNNDLDQKMQAVDERLKALNKTLEAQGIVIEEVDKADSTDASLTDQETRERLSAIKAFMEEKNK